MSQELTENIISKLENPQLVNERGICKFKRDELNNILKYFLDILMSEITYIVSPLY